jgi:hypothetical protein
MKFYYHESMIVYLFSIAAEVASMWNSVALEHYFQELPEGFSWFISLVQFPHHL